MALGRKIGRKPHRKGDGCSRAMERKDGRAGRLARVVRLSPMLSKR